MGGAWSVVGDDYPDPGRAEVEMKVVRHGTRSGYMSHRKRGEVACDACRAANAVYSQSQRSRGRPARPARVPAHERILDLLETYCGEWLCTAQMSLMLGISQGTIAHALARMPSWRFEVRTVDTGSEARRFAERREYRVRVRSYL